MSKYTYSGTHAVLGKSVCQNITVEIPDQVSADQKKYDGKTFPAKLASYGAARIIRVKLRGDWYGLHTSGTGDMIVQRV